MGDHGLLSLNKLIESKFRLGMRTFKTGIAVFIVLLFWNIWLARPSDRDFDSCFG